MAPTFRAGDIRPVLAKPFDQLDGTEIVLRARPGKPVLCHRLVKRTLFGGWTTKGDANDAWDRDALYESNYLGVVMP